MIYQVFIFDESGNRVAVLREASNPSYSRSKNTADQVSFSVTRNSKDIQHIKTGRRFEIIRTINGESDLEASGFISNHGYSGELYEIEGYTEEVALTYNLTPPQYGYVLYSENQTLDQLANELRFSFEVERLKRRWDDPNYLVSSTNIYFDAPSLITIINDGTLADPEYRLSGSVVYQFQKDGDQFWDRVRWVSDYYATEEGEITSKISYRLSNNGSSWGAYTTPVAGALTDIVGLIIADNTPNFLQVKIDFNAPAIGDEPDEQYAVAAPAMFSFEVIKRGPSVIHTVEVDAGASGIATPSLSADNAAFLDVLIAACEPSGYEFEVKDGTLRLAQTFGVDRSDSYSVVAG